MKKVIILLCVLVNLVFAFAVYEVLDCTMTVSYNHSFSEKFNFVQKTAYYAFPYMVRFDNPLKKYPNSKISKFVNEKFPNLKLLNNAGPNNPQANNKPNTPAGSKQPVTNQPTGNKPPVANQPAEKAPQQNQVNQPEQNQQAKDTKAKK